MRQIPMLLWIAALPAIFLMVGCGGDTSQGEQQEDHNNHHSENAKDNHHSENAKVDLRLEGDSGTSGTASFEDTSSGVEVKLELRGLPKPNTFYLAHIHPGTCAEEAEEGHAHEQGEHPGEGEGHEREEYVFGHGEEGEISYALSQVKSNSEGRGSSTTAFGQTSVDKLFSGEAKKHIMVHEAGSGNPPILSCADLERTA
jgi:hypothetical protein